MNTFYQRPLLQLAAFGGILVVMSHAVSAADGTWLTASGNWSDGTKWSSGTIADAATFTASFSSDITTATSVILDSDRTIGNITFNDTGSTGDSTWTLGGTNTLTLSNGSSQAVITKTSAAIINANLAGSNIRVNGGGDLTLTGNNSGISGTFQVAGSNGLYISNGNALGSATLNLSGSPVLGGATTGIAIANNITLNSTLYQGANGLTLNGTLTLNGANQGFNTWAATSATTQAGAVNLGANNLNISGNASGGLIISGVISGSGGIVKSGTSTLTLRGNNTFTGSSTLSDGTVRVANNNTAFGTGAVNITTSTANANATVTVATDNGGGERTLANAFAIANNGTGTSTLRLDGGWAPINLTGIISGNGNVQTASTGTVRLTGSNTYTGSTTVSGGNTLVLSNANATSGITVNSGSSLALRSISLSATQNITGAGNVTKDVSTYGDSTISGTNNNYTGSTVVNISRFTLAAGGVINGTSGISVQAQWGANFNNLGSITTPGAITVAGTGNSTGGGVSADSSMFRNSGTINAASMTLNSSSSANTTANRGGTFTQTSGSTTLTGALTLAANGGTGAPGTAGNDAAFNLSGGSFSANSIAVNAGTFSATAGTVTANSISVASGAVFHASGASTVQGALTTASGSLLTGNGGTFSSTVMIYGNHQLGASPGLQTFSAGLSYGAASNLGVELLGNSLGLRGTDYDALNVTGGILSIDPSSILSLTASGIDYADAVWDINRSFLLISATGASYGGELFLLNASGAGSFADEGAWSLSGGNDGVTLNWTAVPEPCAASIASLVVAAGLLRRRR